MFLTCTNSSSLVGVAMSVRMTRLFGSTTTSGTASGDPSDTSKIRLSTNGITALRQIMLTISLTSLALKVKSSVDL